MSGDVVTLLRKQERDLEQELVRVRTALSALNGSPKVVARPTKVPPPKRVRSNVRGMGHLQELVLEALKSASGANVQTLAAQLGANKSCVNAALQGLDSRKLVERSGRGTKNDAYRWCLPGRREAAE